jgi:multidrug efflux pump subunit AcrA (membrane-fusion protein)
LYRTWPVVAAVALALVLASCGGGGSSSAGTAATTTGGVVTSPASGAAAAELAGTTSKHKAARHRHRDQVEGPQEFIPPPGDYQAEATSKLAVGHSNGGCKARIGDLIDRMDDLRQALLAGLDYSEYVLRVQAVRAAYEAVPIDRLGLACVAGPASHAEDAFNQYLRAANLWGECAGTAGCAASSIESRLQHRWKVASKRLDAAKKPS